ncbi:MAG: NAD(P)-dependent glycerol-3-phosphate dehydrogenase [Proteobacteria bacterium]|nr:NAD(P)-dependent glycerol-3-phosphate dehydrogenase [Pseudomonadota bacterium]
MAQSFTNVGIIGAGAWGTTLTKVLHAAGKNVLLWAREDAVIESINKRHENADFLRGVTLDPAIKATKDYAAFAAMEALFICVPAQYLEATCRSVQAVVKRGMPFVICCKGIDAKTGGLMTEMSEMVAPASPTVVISGPSFATEVVRGLPTALTVASKNEPLAKIVAETISTARIRPYTSTDPIGVQVGGAMKNIFAIGAGIVMSKSLGENARAALVTRGLAEMIRLAVALGGKVDTLMGLSGLGDLMLTACSTQSRNTSLGVAIGRGDKLDKILSQRHSVAEGVMTAGAALARAGKHNIDLPITQAIHDILHKGADITHTLDAMYARPLREEDWN